MAICSVRKDATNLHSSTIGDDKESGDALLAPSSTARMHPLVWLKRTASCPRAAGAQYAAGDRPAVDLGGAVIDAERAHVAEEAGDDRVVGDAEAAQDLHAAVDDPPDRFRADDLGHARFVGAAL